MTVIKKRIAHISENDIHGGAALYTNRLHNYFSKNYNSKIFVLNKSTNSKDVVKLKSKKENIFLKKIKKLEFFFLTNKNKYSFYNKGRYKIETEEKVKPIIQFKPDVLIINNNSEYIHPKIIELIFKKTNCKTYFYPMDDEPFSGGCHYKFDCKGFITGCKICPAVKLYLKKKPSDLLNKKKEYYRNIPATFLCESKRHLNEVKKSFIFNSKKHIAELTYLRIDTDFFTHKKNKKFKKHVISLRSSLNPRKGQSLFIDAIKLIKKKDPNIIHKIKFNILGDSSITKILDNLSFEYDFRSVKNDAQLKDFYDKSNFFLSQSIEDLGPMMINEALSCGLPVIAFNIGVSEDMVNNLNGFKVKNFSVNKLGETMIRISNLSHDKVNKLGINARKTALEFLSMRKFVDTIINYK